MQQGRLARPQQGVPVDFGRGRCLTEAQWGHGPGLQAGCWSPDNVPVACWGRTEVQVSQCKLAGPHQNASVDFGRGRCSTDPSGAHTAYHQSWQKHLAEAMHASLP